jgi:hypothetical protein
MRDRIASLIGRLCADRKSVTALKTALGAVVMIWFSVSLLLGWSVLGAVAAAAAQQIGLIRTFNQPYGTAKPNSAFWMIGQPFAESEVPSGNILKARLGNHRVRVQACLRKLDSDGSLAWAQLLVDYSGVSIPSGGSRNLVLRSTAGSWSHRSTRSNADWEALNDAVVVSNITTTGTSASDMDSGPYTATFNGGPTNTITTLCTSPLGLEVEVKANMLNSGGVAHRFLQAVMIYWVTQKSDGTLGPIASWGPAIENLQMLKPDPSAFTYDLTWYRNGVQQRQQLQVPHVAQTSALMPRPDGLWDWTPTTDDPKIFVTQDYAAVRATGKIPPFADGTSYSPDDGWIGNPTPTIASVNTTTGAFTPADIASDRCGGMSGIMQLNCGNGTYYSPTPIEFTGSLDGLTGISLGTIYWTHSSSSTPTTFTIYDSMSHALAGGATGQIIPGGSYGGSGLGVLLDIAPMSSELYDTHAGDPGSRPDISLLNEWGSAYIVGNTQALQRLGRVMAWALWSSPSYFINDATGKIPSLLDSTGTPPGLGTAMPALDWTGDGTYYGFSTPTGSLGVWVQNRAHFPGSAPYAVWLLEGNPYMQDWLIQNGNQPIAALNPLYRNYRQIQVGGGATYYGVPAYAPDTGIRAIGWFMRDVGMAAFAARQGSPQETYFRNDLANVAAFERAYAKWKGANYTALGLVQVDDGIPIATMQDNGYGSNFMGSFVIQGFSFAALLNGGFVSGLDALADRVPGFLLDEWNQNCPYFADNYNPGWGLSDIGATPPGLYVGEASDLGVGQVAKFSYSGSTVTASVNGWHPAAGPTLPYKTGDRFRPLNYDSDGDPLNPGPPPLIDGTDYCVINPSGNTFQLATITNGICGSIPITFLTSVTNGGGTMMPTGQSCPSTGMFASDATAPDGYLMQERAALALAALRGVPGARGAYKRAVQRFTGNCNKEAMWCLQGSP